MRDALTATDAILDIELPAAPVESGLTVTLTVISVFILLSILSWLSLRRYNSYRSQARRRLRQLRRTVKNSDETNRTIEQASADVRETAFHLARLFCVGVGINGITRSTALPAYLHQHQERWQRFTNDLSTARYACKSTQPPNLDSLFNETLFWLKHWP